ncbi:hypothetical protein PRIPAC_70056 [Pristionchus pacificus]|uniref:G protein-coupled receptor n=1 Tax=Pristionchus pacificus TaxID=54126 RepID=A0A2A6C168_PRIPA|nr:hypothetical protein PRIPAC_70056 [Pristionchus pacificus]|eukprot:PDM71847.1 G protein-coupled receptor [Pristionchus pacificus]
MSLSPTMANLTLHPLRHTVMPVYQHTVGVVTLALSALAFYLMLTKTPKVSKPFTRYLMLLQFSITLVDLYFGALACPIYLFPAQGAICNGILCTWLGAHVAHMIEYNGLRALVLIVYALPVCTQIGRNQDVSAQAVKESVLFTTACCVYFVTSTFYRISTQNMND